MAAAHSIYQLEKQIVQHKTGPPAQDAESSPLINGSVDDPDKVFASALDHELEKICSFYQSKEPEILVEADALLRDVEAFEGDPDGLETEQIEGPHGSRGTNKRGRVRQGSIFQSFLGSGDRRRTSVVSRVNRRIEEEDEGDSDEEADEGSALRKSISKDGHRPMDGDGDEVRNSTGRRPSKRRTSQAYDDYNDMSFSALYDSGITLKKRTISHYVSLCELRSFLQLNKTGFAKVLKKYDKTLDRNLKRSYMEANVESAYPFQKSTMDRLGEYLEKLETAYANLVTNGDVTEAKRELRLHLREHVVWERNTVWRDMIGIERKAQAANLGIRQALLGHDTDPRKPRLQGDEAVPATKEIVTPVGRYRCPSFLLHPTFYTLVAIIAVFFVLLLVPIMKKPEQQNCLAMVVFVSLLWATEVRSSLTIVSKCCADEC